MTDALTQESLFIKDGDHQLHVRHIFSGNLEGKNTRGQPVLMVHGAIENGRIFYNEKGRGLGCFLASSGFDVYVIDLRGRGYTIPTIKPFDTFGQTETIVTDLPLFIDFVYQNNPQPMHLMAHSWGGVLLTSMLARNPKLIDKVRSQIFFGTKRQVRVLNPEALFKIRLMWHHVAPIYAKRHGLLAAKKLGFGSDDETIKSHGQGMGWTKSSQWIDSDDGFDYQQACQQVNWPPTWFVAAIKDKALGHPDDVKRFIVEANYTDAKYTLLSKKNGFKRDYDHISMLTDPVSPKDHFVQIVQWLAEQ